ncbi:MAG TPA: PAS domain S-box protein [Gallionellaceae bacterium]|nr:PAS domain S-box protein [Gallionellaceae bacterium]
MHQPRGAGRALRLLISCNRALFHATDETALLAEVCRLVVETGGYLMAWVGYARNDEARSVEPVAWYGDEAGYVEQLRVSWADNERGRAPTGTAIRTGATQINRNFLTNPALAPWRKSALERGYQSSIALPLNAAGAVFGALSIYAPEPDAFDSEEVRLLEELARDLAFGVVTLRGQVESARLRAEVRTTAAELEGSREQYRQFVELSNEGIWSLDADLNTDFVNPALCRMLGYRPEEMLGRPVSDFVQADEQDKLRRELRERKDGMDLRRVIERRFRRKDGSICWGLVTATWLKDARGAVRGGFAMITDIGERKQMERALAESRETFQMLVDSSPTAINILDGNRLLFVNAAMERLSGYSREELLGMNVSDLVHPDSRQQVLDRIAARQRGEDVPMQYEIELLTRKGETRWIEVNAARVIYDGTACSLASLLDITGRKRAEEALQLAAEVFEHAGEGVLVTDEHNRIIAANPAFTQITGYTLEEVQGQDPRVFASGRHDREFYRAMWQEIIGRGYWEGEIWDRNKNGEIHAKHLTISVIRDEAGRAYRYVALFTDITQRKQSEELIWRQANFDGLTGLPNRQMFHDRLEQEAKKSHRTGRPMALLLIDLDHFKEVNDSLGHQKGDMLLVDAAGRVVSCVRESDTVARLGGDEFVVILSELDDLESIDRIAQDLVEKLAASFKLGPDEVYVSASIGISLYPADTTHLDGLLKNADQAMYSAKGDGRNRFSYFTPDMQEAARKRLRLAGELRAALAQGQFRVYYQPIVVLASGQIHKAEALLRWEHPERGIVGPEEFVALAEDTGLIVPIGEWVFRQATAHVLAWRAAGRAGIAISVNKSSVQMRHDASGTASWPEYLRQIGLDGSAVTVEIAEGMLMNADTAVNDKLRAFHEAGMCIAVDDFGTGSSSLAYLRDFNIDLLKIDRSLIRDLESNTDHQALCEAIIVMAHKLGMQVVAEGVETAAQRELLLASGCDYAQGYLFGAPMPAEEFWQLLERR